MALAYYKLCDDQTSLGIWKIEETAAELYEQLQLKDHETDYLEKLNNGRRSLHWLSTRVLLRKMLNTQEYIDCQVDAHGKPYLVNSPYYISLSHSFDYAAVMVSEGCRVGIDIELIKDKIGRVAKKFMKPSELAFMDPSQTVEHLYACWCAKEAVYKLQGKRNVSFLDNIEIAPFQYNGKGSFTVSLNSDHSNQKFIVRYEKFHDYMLGYSAETSYSEEDEANYEK
jgi:phosphopantetheine--protein transferase-like protein